MPYIMQVAVGRRDHLTVFGNDYPTPDGTGVRDYLHVVDLAEGHLAALDRLDDIDRRSGGEPRHRGRAARCSRSCARRAPRSVTRSPTRSGRAAPATSSPAWADPAPAASAARLASDAHPRRHVRRPLALAVSQSRRLPVELAGMTEPTPHQPL